MELHRQLVCLVLLGSWGLRAEGKVIGGPGHHSLNSWRFDGDAVRQRCLERSVTNVTCAHVSEDRLLVHPDDCELFYYCVGDVAICRQCPAQLHFSPTKHVCDRPQDAGCEPRPTTAGEPSTSAASSTTFTTSPPTLPVNDSSTYPGTTASVSPSPAPSEATTGNSMTTYIKLQ